MSTDSKSLTLPTFQMLLICAECGRGIEVPLPTDRSLLAIFLARQGWFMSVLTPPNQDPKIPIVLGALCSSCASHVWPPEALKSAEEWRQRALAGTP